MGGRKHQPEHRIQLSLVIELVDQVSQHNKRVGADVCILSDDDRSFVVLVATSPKAAAGLVAAYESISGPVTYDKGYSDAERKT